MSFCEPILSFTCFNYGKIKNFQTSVHLFQINYQRHLQHLKSHYIVNIIPLMHILAWIRFLLTLKGDPIAQILINSIHYTTHCQAVSSVIFCCIETCQCWTLTINKTRIKNDGQIWVIEFEVCGITVQSGHLAQSGLNLIQVMDLIEPWLHTSWTGLVRFTLSFCSVFLLLETSKKVTW